MKVLIDTHTFIWFCENDKNLPEKAKATIENTGNEVYINTVSLWEITIKQQLKKLSLSKTLADILKLPPQYGFQYLDIKTPHLLTLSSLDFLHKDPFDRILIAQAMAEDMLFITRDDSILQYPELKLLWT